MSITFSPELGEVIGWAVTDHTGGYEEFDLGARLDAEARLLLMRNTDVVLEGSDPNGDPFWLHEPVIRPIWEGGDLQDQLAELQKISVWAKAHGRPTVQWA